MSASGDSRRSMGATSSPTRVWPTFPAGLCGLGFWPIATFYAMKSGQLDCTASAHSGKRGAEAGGSGSICWWPSKFVRPGVIPLRIGAPYLASLRLVLRSVCGIVFPASRCGDARDHPAKAPSLPAAVAEIPMSVRSHPCPQPHVGHGRRTGVQCVPTARTGFHRHRPLERRVVGRSISLTRRRIVEATSGPPMVHRVLRGLDACELRRCGGGAGLADGCTASQYCRLDHCHQTRSSSDGRGPTPSSNSRRRGFSETVQSHA